MYKVTDNQGGNQVRWGLREDEPRIAELLELNGISGRAAKGRFIVAERDGRAVAALRYEMEPRKLVLGLLVMDPWSDEPVLARTVYSEVHALARERGVREVVAAPNRYGDYLYEAGYLRAIGGWRLDTARRLRSHEDLPAGGWRGLVALLGVTAIPFFQPFRGASDRTDSDGEIPGSMARRYERGCSGTASRSATHA